MHKKINDHISQKNSGEVVKNNDIQEFYYEKRKDWFRSSKTQYKKKHTVKMRERNSNIIGNNKHYDLLITKKENTHVRFQLFQKN